jgi:flagellar biogenesis protein FliO
VCLTHLQFGALSRCHVYAAAPFKKQLMQIILGAIIVLIIIGLLAYLLHIIGEPDSE